MQLRSTKQVKLTDIPRLRAKLRLEKLLAELPDAMSSEIRQAFWHANRVNSDTTNITLKLRQHVRAYDRARQCVDVSAKRWAKVAGNPQKHQTSKSA